MNDQMPMFEDPPPNQLPEDPPPSKKPRQKPVRRGRPKGAAGKVPKKAAVKRRKRQVKPVTEKHAGGRYSRDVYAAIGALMGMKTSDRDAVLDIVQGLVGGH